MRFCFSLVLSEVLFFTRFECSFLGEELIHPFIPSRKMIIVADNYVDKEFGTGNFLSLVLSVVLIFTRFECSFHLM